MSIAADIALRVELPPPLAQRLADARWRQALTEALRTEVGQLAAALGVPGSVAVELAAAPPVRANAVNGIRVRVGGTLCRFTQEHVARAHSLANNDVFVRPTVAELDKWLEADDPKRFVVGLAREAVARDPSVLLGPGQLQRVAAAWDIVPSQCERLGAILREVLKLGISIDSVAGPARSVDPAVSVADAAEAMIATGRAATIDIHLSGTDLRWLTLDADERGTDRFASLRDWLFHDNGLRFPDLRLVEDASLPPGHFAFKVNSVLGLPWVGLAADERLVDDSASSVADAYGVRVRPATHVQTGAVLAVASALPPDHELAIWSAFEYIVLCLSVELRRLAPRLLDEAVVANEIDGLGAAFPTLVRCARERYSGTQLVHVLRSLAAEDIPIRDLRLILTALVEFDTIPIDPAEYVIFDDRVPMTHPSDVPPIALLVAAIRVAHRRFITHQQTGGNWTLSALVVPPELEREIRDRDARGALVADAAWCDRLLDAVAVRIPASGETAGPACLLTTPGSRDALRRLVALEAPQVPVLCYQDLAPGVNISVLGRIELDSAPAG